MEPKVQHSLEARLLAALSHASVMLQGLGLITGVVVYFNQREKDRFAAFQALQAAVYQAFALVAVIGSWILWTIFYVISLIPLMSMTESSAEAPPPLFWAGLFSMLIPLIIMLVFGLYGLIGAWATWQGRDFRYPILGPWLEKSGFFKIGE